MKSFVEGIQLATVNPEVAKRAFRKHMRLQQERDLDDAYQILRGFMERFLRVSGSGLHLDKMLPRRNGGSSLYHSCSAILFHESNG